MDSIEKLSMVSMACTIVLRPPGAFLPPDCGKGGCVGSRAKSDDE